MEAERFCKTNVSTRIFGKIVVLVGSYSFPIIKNLNPILRNSFLPVGFNVFTVIEIKCFVESPDFTKFGLENFTYVSFEKFLYINYLYKFCSSY